MAYWRKATKNTRRRQIEKLLLLVALSALVTLMVSPDLDLVSLRYDEGDIVSQDIVIPDNLMLRDDRSTDVRVSEAIADFPPIYDHDTRLKAATVDQVRAVFQQSREVLAELANAQVEWQARLRDNSLEKIAGISAYAKLDDRLSQLRAEKDQIINDVGVLNDLSELTADQSFHLEKLRFDLVAVHAHLASQSQALQQMAKRLEQLDVNGAQLAADVKKNRLEGDNRLLGLRTDLEKTLRVALEDTTMQVFLQARFNEDLENNILSIIEPALDRKIVGSLESLDPPGGAIQIQVLESDELNRFEDLDSITDVAGLRASLDKLGQDPNLFGEDTVQREAVITLSKRLVQPNLTENKGETERLKQELAKTTSPVFFNLKKGDVVARAGERIGPQQVEVIGALNTYKLQNPKYPQLIGTFLVILLTLGVFYQLIVQRTAPQARSFSRLLLMSALLLLPLAIAGLVLLVVPGLAVVYDLFPPGTYNYLIPAALAAMLGGILLGFEVGIFLGFSVSLCLAILLDNSLSFFIFSLMGSFVAALPMKSFDSRYDLWRQGVRISAINVPIILVLALVEQRPMDYEFWLNMGAGFLNGFGVAFLATILLPFLESAFDITTNLRLLELSNMNHPALKELAVRAPGTYHHSIVVGNLAESVAEGTSANALLVRVASYYHDLGKMLCPLYFVENQHNKNYHDDLPAKTSAKIIISHVKNGLEIAKRHRLGQAISDILGQHHGTSLVRYFYHKAKEEQGDLDTPLEESEFRYPGPKPQTKESGLVMLADITESATRSLEEASEEAIRTMVQKQTTRIYSEGQLDESGMTFNDLNYIEKTFTKILLSVHHHRISYPELRQMVRVEHDLDDETDAQQPSDSDLAAKHPAVN